jgi:peptidoglycan/xylan/chitin deacetylase (PgdA/CDA1 family)
LAARDACHIKSPGPTDTTAEILDILKEFGAKATFFNIGEQAENPITTRLVNEGHELGGHTFVVVVVVF